MCSYRGLYKYKLCDWTGSNRFPCILHPTTWFQRRNMTALKGIHHVTAISADPQRNVDFYSGVLGLRLVKKTVNFDDPGSYHLYYGDRFGTPGTLVTFFVWPGAARGRTGAGEPVALTYEVPEGLLSWWKERFAGAGVSASESKSVLGANLISVADPDGMRVELLEGNQARE